MAGRWGSALVSSVKFSDNWYLAPQIPKANIGNEWMKDKAVGYWTTISFKHIMCTSLSQVERPRLVNAQFSLWSALTVFFYAHFSFAPRPQGSHFPCRHPTVAPVTAPSRSLDTGVLVTALPGPKQELGWLFSQVSYRVWATDVIQVRLSSLRGAMVENRRFSESCIYKKISRTSKNLIIKSSVYFTLLKSSLWGEIYINEVLLRWPLSVRV